MNINTSERIHNSIVQLLESRARRYKHQALTTAHFKNNPSDLRVHVTDKNLEALAYRTWKASYTGKTFKSWKGQYIDGLTIMGYRVRLWDCGNYRTDVIANLVQVTED